MRPLLALLVLAGGCRTRPFELDDDAGMPVRDLAGIDFGPDMTQNVCRVHQREFVNIASFAPLDDSPQLGRAIRVRVDIPLRETCDQLADVSTVVQIGNATDFVVITARAWKGSGPCGMIRTVSRAITISDFPGPLSNPRIVVRDGAPGGMAELTISPSMSTGSCGSVPAMCTLDCHCGAPAATTRCLTGVCLTPCSEDVDCPAMSQCQNFLPSSARFACLFTPPSPCCPNGCLFGQSCQNCRCTPLPANNGKTCGCDRDCAVNEICADRVEIGGDPITPTCFIPCVTPRDCPPLLEACVSGRCHPLE